MSNSVNVVPAAAQLLSEVSSVPSLLSLAHSLGSSGLKTSFEPPPPVHWFPAVFI